MSSLITTLKAEHRKAAAELASANKRLTKADANVRSAAAELQSAREAVKTAEAKQQKYDHMLKMEQGDSTKAKPGPKAAPAAKKTAVKAKPGPKPKAAKAKPGPKPKAAKAKAAPKKSASVSRAAQGRREVASGKRPPIKEVISKVLGKRVLHANEVYEAIKAKGQLPNSGDPRAYIGYLLSASKTTVTRAGKDVEVPLFERVHEKGRGFYKNRGVAVSKGASKPAPAAKKAAKPAAKPAPAKKTAAKAEPKKAGPTKDGKRTVTCKVCGQPGHNSKGHDRAMAAAKAESKPKAETKTEPKPKAAAAPKTEDGKRTVKCGKCGALGHNAKGHDRAVAAAAKSTTNGHGGAAKAAEAKVEKAEPEPAKAAESTKSDDEKSTDEILAEAGIDAPAL